MRPLDGGVLSLGRARTPARGRWAEPLFFSLGHRGRLLLRLFYERRCANEREEEAKNELGFERAAAVEGFSSGRNARRSVDRRSTASSASGRFEPRHKKNSQPRPRLWLGRGGGAVLVRGNRLLALGCAYCCWTGPNAQYKFIQFFLFPETDLIHI